MSVKSDDEKLAELAKKLEKHLEVPEESNFQKGNYSYASKALTDIAAGIGVGWFIGYQIDNYFNSEPIFTLILIILGLVAGLWNLYKDSNKE